MHISYICCCLFYQNGTRIIIYMLQRKFHSLIDTWRTGHPQLITLIHCNNSTTVDIANDTFKKQWSKSIKMHYFWFSNLVEHKEFDIHWHASVENIIDKMSKYCPVAHHQLLCPLFVQLFALHCETKHSARVWWKLAWRISLSNPCHRTLISPNNQSTSSTCSIDKAGTVTWSDHC